MTLMVVFLFFFFFFFSKRKTKYIEKKERLRDPEGAVESGAEDWEVKVQAPAIVDGPAAAAVGDFLLAAAFVCQPQEQSLSLSVAGLK